MLASDQFLTYRESTKMMTVLAGLPWFTDWGRDTMIAFTGLTLCTKRFKEAEEILLTFARYIRHGIVPNMFPDDNMPPLYNTPLSGTFMRSISTFIITRLPRRKLL